jgi:hypothetical protein
MKGCGKIIWALGISSVIAFFIALSNPNTNFVNSCILGFIVFCTSYAFVMLVEDINRK